MSVHRCLDWYGSSSVVKLLSKSMLSTRQIDYILVGFITSIGVSWPCFTLSNLKKIDLVSFSTDFGLLNKSSTVLWLKMIRKGIYRVKVYLVLRPPPHIHRAFACRGQLYLNLYSSSTYVCKLELNYPALQCVLNWTVPCRLYHNRSLRFLSFPEIVYKLSVIWLFN